MGPGVLILNSIYFIFSLRYTFETREKSRFITTCPALPLDRVTGDLIQTSSSVIFCRHHHPHLLGDLGSHSGPSAHPALDQGQPAAQKWWKHQRCPKLPEQGLLAHGIRGCPQLPELVSHVQRMAWAHQSCLCHHPELGYPPNLELHQRVKVDMATSHRVQGIWRMFESSQGISQSYR